MDLAQEAEVTVGYSKDELVRALEALLESESRGNVDLNELYKVAREIGRKVRSEPSLSDLVPETVWHYLSDVDIRMREPEYRAMQRDDLIRAIESLKRG